MPYHHNPTIRLPLHAQPRKVNYPLAYSMHLPPYSSYPIGRQCHIQNQEDSQGIFVSWALQSFVAIGVSMLVYLL